MMRTFLFSVFLYLSASQITAQTIYGPGSKPCSELVKAWEGGSFFDKNFFDAWVTGFVGGANWASKKAIKIEELQSEVLGHKSKLETHTVETHVYRLRKKILRQFKDNSFIGSSKKGYFIF